MINLKDFSSVETAPTLGARVGTIAELSEGRTVHALEGNVNSEKLVVLKMREIKDPTKVANVYLSVGLSKMFREKAITGHELAACVVYKTETADGSALILKAARPQSAEIEIDFSQAKPVAKKKATLKPEDLVAF